MAQYQTPRKIRKHKDADVEAEFRNVYDHLGKLALGMFSFFFDPSTNTLYLQKWNEDTHAYISVMSIATTGAVSATGAFTGSATLTNMPR